MTLNGYYSIHNLVYSERNFNPNKKTTITHLLNIKQIITFNFKLTPIITRINFS